MPSNLPGESVAPALAPQARKKSETITLPLTTAHEIANLFGEWGQTALDDRHALMQMEEMNRPRH